MKTVIKYYTNNCAPCRTYTPTFEQVASQTPGVQFQSVDASSGDPRILEHGIRNVPTTVVVENGQVRKQTGVLSVEQLRAFIG
ncbi:thioredoxin family protein [Candidatus Pelagibacter sp.]|nr:thioredoxin family protein [Candidatus Pelagibacter sp.]